MSVEDLGPADDLFAGAHGAVGLLEAGREMLAHADEASEFLKSIANPHRLLVLCALASSRREISVSELEAMLELRQPTLSQQLARLRETGLVSTRRVGKSIYYRLNCNRAGIIVLLLHEWFCATGREPTGRKT